MQKIICIGSSTKDIIFPIMDGEILETPDDIECQKKLIFELGAKYQVAEHRHESIGGCAANVACGLSRLGIEAACCTRVGDDESGKWLKSELEKNEVKIGLVQVGNHQSDLSTILAHVPSEDRIIFSDRDANEKLEIVASDLENFGAGWIFVSSLNGNAAESWEEKLDKIMAFAEEKDLKVIFNPGQKNIKSDPQRVVEAVKKSEILIVNKDEAIEIVDKLDSCDLSRIQDEKFLAESLLALGLKVVALTDGVRGAWGSDGKEFLHVDSRPEKISDTLGAGDAFTSAFIAAHLKEKNLQECLDWGIKNSSSVVQKYGAVEGLLKENEIEG